MRKWCLGFAISSKSNSVLLLRKSKTLHIGMWNGLGGKIEHTETSHQAMIRECLEESKLNIPSWEHVGYLRDFYYTWEVDVFTTNVREAQLDEISIPHFWELSNLNIDDTAYEVPLIDLPRMQLAPHTGTLIYACLEKLHNNNTPTLEIKI